MSVKWIKLTTNMFDDEKIKLIESMPDKDTILIIWIKLLIQAGKTNASGYLYLNENLPYTEEMLSTIFNRPIGTVRMALEVFKRFEMVEIDDQHFISISNWEKHQNIEGMDKIREQNRLRKQKQRHNQRLLSPVTKRDGDMCQYCGEDATGFDHIIPISQGGSDDHKNKVSCCIRCNNAKTTLDVLTFLNYNIQEFINKDVVMNNEILSKLVFFDGFKFVSRDITGHVTRSHALDIEEELDIDIEKKKNKKVKVAEFVSMSEEEQQKLIALYGETKTAKMIDILDNYKGATGKRYKSDYRAILNWVVKRVEEENGRTPKGNKQLDTAKYDELSL